MAVTVADASVLIDLLAGIRSGSLVDAAARFELVLPPLVVAELVTGAHTIEERNTLAELLQDVPVHRTDLHHWIDVGNLRRSMAFRGLNVTIPDAHIAQCALELNAVLLSRDDIFPKMARYSALRVGA